MASGGEFAKLDSFLVGEGGARGKGADAGAGLLPKPINPAWYDAEEKSWYGEKDLKDLSKKERQRLIACACIVQYSPTGRAKCRRCGETIDKGVLRLGYPFRFRDCEDAYPVYLHPECYEPTVFGIREKELRSKVFGYEALNSTERARLWKAMQSSGRANKAASAGKVATKEYAKGSVGLAVSKKVAVPVPKEVCVNLLPFQKEGLAWMCQQEMTEVRGGILADEMGMGKTIQAISLLLARPAKGPCLVVCPMAAVQQWAAEIEKFIKRGSLRTLVYHGVHKRSIAAEFKKADVVITTYQTLETEYRNETNKQRVACKWCRKLFLPEKLVFHQKYFCGPEASRTAKQQKTAKKNKDAAGKAMSTMGIGQSASSSSVYAPPTITNIYKDCMQQAGVNVKAKGYWNVVKETRDRVKGQASASSSSGKEEGLSRERLKLLDRNELQGYCKKRGLDQAGTKPDLVERLMDFAVRSMALPSQGKTSLAKQLVAKAKASAASRGKPAVLPLRKKPAAKGAKGAVAVSQPRGANDSARTVASVRAANAVCASAGAKGKAKCGMDETKGLKRKHGQLEDPCAGHGQTDNAHYQTFEGAQLDLSNSPLHAVLWSRIVLDEAHRIKGRTTSTAMAAYALQTEAGGSKWCLTGTPLQNRVGELYSLIRFLRVRPFAFYYCKIKGCNCECAKFMRERYCPNCGHVRFCHYSHFKRNVSNPIIKYGFMGAGREAFSTLRNDILNKVMLRRTKEERKADLKLPPIKVSIRKDKLSKQEMDFYQSLYMQSCVKFDTYVKGGTVLHNYAHIFDLLTSLRRAVDHPYLIVHGNSASSAHQLPSGARFSAKVGDVCALCQDDVTSEDDGEEGQRRAAKCGHVFHDECIRAYLNDAPKLKSGGVGCPTCFVRLNIDLGDNDGGASDADEPAARRKRKATDHPSRTPMKAARPTAGTTPLKRARAAPAICDAKAQGTGGRAGGTAAHQWGSKGIMRKVRAADFHSSTKIEALLSEVQAMTRKDATSKAIVFSQFGAMLELVDFRLKRSGISCVVFRGGMTMQARNDALAAFNTDPSLKVILISLKAGGEGLNLQVANHVFLLDPWWNPACEMQAIQRAHRIGQHREVRAVRFITTDTVEEKIMQLQQKKQLVFDASIDGSQASMAKLTEQDLRFLFQH